MTNKEREYLVDTIGILVDYDGCRTVDQLKDLIDETRERLSSLVVDGIEEDTN